MTDTEKLELRRKVCEALGYSITNEAVYRGSEQIGTLWIVRIRAGFLGRYKTEEIAVNALPALESDNGLALDALVKWCEENSKDFAVESRGSYLVCRIWTRGLHFGFTYPGEATVVNSETPAIAICKAIIAASSLQVC